MRPLPWPYPQKRTLAIDPDFETGEASMEFRLTYEGQLFASANKSRPAHVHCIRQQFHRQLKCFWELHRGLAVWPTQNPPPSFGGHPLPEGFRWKTKRDELAYKFSRNGYRFVPLVTEDLFLSCGLEILFLRQDGPILQTGDIDGRLKTLFDALTMPRHAEQLKGNEVPIDGEDPFFCLLEDDSLVSSVSVETDVLLQPTGAVADQHDSRLVVTVRIKPNVVTMGNLHFG